ncbi:MULTISPECIES: N-acetyl sugar amidotransferase [unclassified Variovorax]|uniref:N-acetyl sugar amidotransferase n=1 Tax=unclassified Variovorax TaxID=663243 RepID=UPI001BD59F37|nr:MULTISPECIES: N-acetyl sugar amidotransferase [unclassified Variovorax]
MSNAYCKRCALPSTRRGVEFDNDGICSVCRHHEFKNGKVDWDSQERVLRDLVEGVRGKAAYDAVVPFGGGKDGTYVLFYLTRVLGLRCLAITVDNRFLRQSAWENCARVLDELGVDQVTFRPPIRTVQRLMQVGLSLAGTVCWHCTAGISAFPVRTAIERGIPLVVYAHSLKEYYAYPGRTYRDPSNLDVVNQEWYELVTAINFDRMAEAVSDLDPIALRPFEFPSMDEISSSGVRAIFLSNYILWDEARQASVIAEELGWKGASQEGVPIGREYEKFDCFLVGAHDYLRFIKEGYGRGARIGSLEARLGKMSSEEALNLGRSSDGRRPASLDKVIEILEIDEEEFLDFAVAHSQPGSNFDVEGVKRGEPLPDADLMPDGRSFVQRSSSRNRSK